MPWLQPCHLLPELESYSSSCVLRRNPGVPAATAHGAQAGIPGGSSSICKTYLIIEHVHSLRRGLRLDLDGSLTNRCLTLWSTAECFISRGSPKGSETTAFLARGRNGSFSRGRPKGENTLSNTALQGGIVWHESPSSTDIVCTSSCFKSAISKSGSTAAPRTQCQWTKTFQFWASNISIKTSISSREMCSKQERSGDFSS